MRTPRLDTAVGLEGSPGRLARAAVMRAALALDPQTYPNAAVSRNSRGEYLLWPHGVLGGYCLTDLVWTQDRVPPKPRLDLSNWPAVRGAWVLASKVGAGVKAGLVWILTLMIVVVFVGELVLLDYLRGLGGAPANRQGLARKVRASMTAHRIAAFMGPGGFGYWPSLGLFTIGIGVSLWLHLAAFLWLAGCTILP